MVKEYDLEKHVESIITAQGPEGALKGRYRYDFLERILTRIHKRKKLLDLRAYHFKGTLSMWNERGVTNYPLARKATGELLDMLQERYGWDFEEVVSNIKKEYFTKEPIRYQVTLHGMLAKVYGDSPSQAVMDFLKHHSQWKVREKFADLKEYHFKKGRNIWSLKDGTKNHALARQATGELLDMLQERYGWDFEEAISNIRQKHFVKEPIKYKAVLQGMLAQVYGDSPSQAVIDFLKHHPRQKVREKFKDLKEYHFKKGQQNLWTFKDGTKNHALARQATGELLDMLQERYGWDFEEAIANIRRIHFVGEKIKYGTTLRGMIIMVYGDSPRKAIQDYLKSFHIPSASIKHPAQY